MLYINGVSVAAGSGEGKAAPEGCPQPQQGQVLPKHMYPTSGDAQSTKQQGLAAGTLCRTSASLGIAKKSQHEKHQQRANYRDPAFTSASGHDCHKTIRNPS